MGDFHSRQDHEDKKGSLSCSHGIFQMIDDLLLLIENYKASLKVEAFEHIKGDLIISRASSEFLGVDDLLLKVEDAIHNENSSLKKNLSRNGPLP